MQRRKGGGAGDLLTIQATMPYSYVWLIWLFGQLKTWSIWGNKIGNLAAVFCKSLVKYNFEMVIPYCVILSVFWVVVGLLHTAPSTIIGAPGKGE